jgi:hypothetical protein
MLTSLNTTIKQARGLNKCIKTKPVKTVLVGMGGQSTTNQVILHTLSPEFPQ